MNLPLKRYRKGFRHSYAFGISPTLELLRRRPEAVLGVVADRRCARSPAAREIRGLCCRIGVDFEVNDARLARLGCKASCVMAGVFHKYHGRLDPGANHVVLHRPQYAGNVGAIARTMIGFGFANLAVIRPAVQVLDPESVRSSMGAVFRLEFAYFDSFEDYRRIHARAVYAFLVHAGESINRVSFAPPLSLLFGNEGSGLPEGLSRSGRSVTIPHTRAIDSLNLAVAVGISLYEVNRRMKELPPR